MNVICRPELHDATTSEQYNEFHVGMKEFGLLRTITRDGKVYKLPNAEYLGVNLSTSMLMLDCKINALAIRITGHRCKLTLTPVQDVSTIYISGLEEDTSYESTLGAFAGLGNLLASSYPGPNYSALSALAATGSKGGTLPAPSGLPDSLQSSFVAALSRKG